MGYNHRLMTGGAYEPDANDDRCEPQAGPSPAQTRLCERGDLSGYWVSGTNASQTSYRRSRNYYPVSVWAMIIHVLDDGQADQRQSGRCLRVRVRARRDDYPKRARGEAYLLLYVLHAY